MLQIGDTIKYLRIKNKYTQTQLAEKLGLQLTTMQKYENGMIRNVKLDTLQKLCRILDAPPAMFVFPNIDDEGKNRLLEHAITTYSGLNDEGIKKLIAYIEDLRKIEDYTVQDETKKQTAWQCAFVNVLTVFRERLTITTIVA